MSNKTGYGTRAKHSDEKLLGYAEQIKEILEKGQNAEVKCDSNGDWSIYEVNKRKVKT